MTMHTVVIVPFPDATARDRVLKAFAERHPHLSPTDVNPIPSPFLGDGSAVALGILNSVASVRDEDMAHAVFAYICELHDAVFIRDAVDHLVSIPVRLYAEEAVTGIASALMGKDAIFAVDVDSLSPRDVDGAVDHAGLGRRADRQSASDLDDDFVVEDDASVESGQEG